MSPVLPFDIIALIIDIVGENKDTNLKELALVSHSFLQICRKHIFATIELYDDVQNHHLVSSKSGFLKLLKSRPNVVNYIRKLTYEVSHIDDDDFLLSPILSDFLPTISRLNYLAITASRRRRRSWSTLVPSLTSAFLHLMSLPTINHIDLSYIANFPLSSLTLSVNLLRLDILCLTRIDYSDQYRDDGFLKHVQSETMPNIREFHTSGSSLLTAKLLDAKRQDGRPAFNVMDLRQLSMSFIHLEDEPNIRYLLQNAELLEKLHLSVDYGQSLVGILSTSSRTLKALDMTVSLYHYDVPPLAGLCEELEAMAMAGHNMLEALSFEVHVEAHHTGDYIGSVLQKVESILVKPGWSALRQVSFKLPLKRWGVSTELFEALYCNLQCLPDKYLSHLSKLESVAFHYSAYFV